MWEDLGNLLCDMGVIPTPSTNRDPKGPYIFQASRDLRTILRRPTCNKNTPIQFDCCYNQQKHMQMSRGYCSTIIYILYAGSTVLFCAHSCLYLDEASCI